MSVATTTGPGQVLRFVPQTGGRSQGDGVRRAVSSSARYAKARHAVRALALPVGLPSCTVVSAALFLPLRRRAARL
eukprot:6212059-Pleurochrysis_carterae.AAC.1